MHTAADFLAELDAVFGPEPGVSSTPGSLQKMGFGDVSRIRRVGIDWLAFYVGLSGAAAENAGSLSQAGSGLKGMWSYKHLGRRGIDPETGRPAFDFFAPEGYVWGYSRDQQRLLVVTPRDDLFPVAEVGLVVSAALSELRKVGIEPTFGPYVQRVDVTADVLVGDPIFGTALMAAVQQGRYRDGRELLMRKPWSAALLSSTGTQLGNVYDKGREQRERAGGVVSDWRWMRLEARSLHQYGENLRPEGITSELARRIFLDRFGGLPMAPLPATAGAQLSAKRLLREGVSATVVLKLVGFLELDRSGMAEASMSRDAYLRMRAECKRYRLGDYMTDVRDGLPDELDIRAVIDEMALAL